MEEKQLLAQIRNLSVEYKTRLGQVSAVDGVSFDIYKGEILGLVGESGCGKSTMGKALMRMIQPPGKITDGQIIFQGEDIMTYDDNQMRDFRGRKVSMIFQDPMTSLNPTQRVDEHIIEAIQVHESQTKTEEALTRAEKMIRKLGMQRRRMNSYPHQLSGGMRQRVMVGLGLVLNADLIVADEATTSLDVIVEAQLADQLKDIREEFGVSLLVITHNIALVAEISDRIVVMYAGHVMEIADVEPIFDNPLHPYTRGLLKSIPNIKLVDTEELYKMPGEPPNLTHPPSGCRFHPRCPRAMPICKTYEPDLEEVSSGRFVKCWLYIDHPEKESETIKVEA
ncbi:MAG: ABC transporter ATP-binding protein [Brevefilum sp.]|nr:ABC transporter ATP-binding protein [Brevefilum sp.]MDT8382449.1 ABC transporter ATP-binding protein [Brevefilum sp.]MDW7755024.1 ABC transporter ATP-binding protein [Brevefilum sp.]